MTALAPAARMSCARSTVRTPPPTLHVSSPAMRRTMARLSPLPMAASRSMTCTLGKRSKRRTHFDTSSSRIASRSPCTSCTTAPPFKSIAGISMKIQGEVRTQKSEVRTTTQKSELEKSSEPHWNVVFAKVSLQRVDAGFSVVKDRRRERCVSGAAREDIHEVVKASRAARSDDGDGYRFRDGGGHLAV